jgi:hypothetical protein
MASPDLFGNLAGDLSGVVGSALSFGVKLIVGIILLVGIGFFLVHRNQKKQFNIPITIWIPRSDGKITDEIKAVGGYFKNKQPNGGQITSFNIKRKGQKVCEIPPPSSRFLIGLNRKLYLVQKGIDDFEPVLPDSFRYVKTPEGKRILVVDLNCINQDATAWTEDNRESSKRRFTFANFWERYKDFIQITIFIFIVMLTLYIFWISMKDVVAGLQQVADSLRPSISSSVKVN